jgi:LacI family transcriptional regulator, gluconate utilization system Gnt-I transcriptional repressor
VAAGAAAMAALLTAGPKVQAVFCTNDMIAVGAMQECRRRGLDIPRQMAVMGFSDLPIAQSMAPALTTVQVGARKIGALAAEMILQRLDMNLPKKSRVDLGFSVVARQST